MSDPDEPVPDPGGPDALARTHEWFAHHSGWAPPDEDTMADWRADGVSRAPDDCLVPPEGICPHGLVSWPTVLATVDDWPPGRPGGPVRRH